MNNSGWYQNPYGGYGRPQEPIWNSGQRYGQMPQSQTQQSQQLSLYDVIGQGTRVDWVQGEAAVKSYMVRPGMSVILLDMENPNRMYVKACNMAGVPIFTEGFDLGKIQFGQSVQLNDERYVPREEYEKSMNQIAKLFANLTEQKGENHECQIESTARLGHESERAAEPADNTAGTGFPGV